MNKSKKVLSGILAVLMLVSMLACFVLPATAEETEKNHFYVSSVGEWNALAGSGVDWTDENNVIHIQENISFKTKKTYEGTNYMVYTMPTTIENFGGTLDGHGYKFSDINAIDGYIGSLTKTQNSDGTYQQEWVDGAGTALIGTLTGTIKDLTLDSSCTFDAGDTASFGPFALALDGGTIQKCASYATYDETTAPGGFVGEAPGGTIDGCIFAGTGTTNAFAADSTDATIQYSYPHDTITDVKEAVWTINSQREQYVKDGIYLNVDENGKPCFGDEYNRVVRAMFSNKEDPVYYAPRNLYGDNNHTVQNRFKAAIDGKIWEVSGAEPRGNYIYVGHEDITVTYYDTVATSDVEAMDGATFYTEYKIEQEKEELRSMVKAYEAMDSAYFSDFTFEINKNAWITKANDALEGGDFDALTQEEYAALSTDDEKTAAIKQETARIAELEALSALLQEIIKEEENLDDYAIAMTDPEDYPSIQDYDTYKYVDSIKGYKIENAADWMKAVELSNYVVNPNATNFAGITLHLAKNIDMSVYPEDYEGSTQMLPLCYSGYFDGNLDGHGYAFENVKMEIESPYGPVGLIGVLGETAAGKVQNVGIESGSIKVTGQPRFKQLLNVSGSGNLVGGLVGKNYVADTLIRKCWNNADISVENSSYVAGILGDGRKGAIIDSCINQGNTSGNGILGYGYTLAKTYNSMSGAVHRYAVGYRGGITGIVADKADTTDVNEYESSIIEENIEASMANYICNVSGVKMILEFSSYTSGLATEQSKAAKDYNFKYSVMSNAAAGWTINANYVDTPYGDRVYYTLDENGDVRFGDKSNQIYRIEMVCESDCDGDGTSACTEHDNRYAYGIAGQEITLGFDVKANYYACSNENVTIKGNVLKFSEGAEAEDNTFTVYVGYNANRGDVNNDSNINVLDALDAVRMVVDPETAVLKTADVNSNHEVDIRDAYQIIRYALSIKNNKITADFVAGGPDETEYLKVASYNVKSMYYDPTDGASNKDQDIGTALSRKEEVMAELKAIDADIMGFQELINGHKTYTGGAHLLEVIRDELNSWNTDANYEMDYVPLRYYSQNDDGTDNVDGPTAGNGIISKYPILDSKTECFAGLGQPDDVTKRLDDTLRRGFTCYQIDLNDSDEYEVGTDIIFCNTHLATTSDEVSAAEIQYMLQYMKTYYAEDRVVFAGDMNLGAYHTEAVLGKVNNQDVRYIALNGGENYNTYTRTNPHSGSMVDNIFVSDNVEYFHFAESALSGAPALNTSATLYPGTGDYASEQWTASDHLPIWAYIKK